MSSNSKEKGKIRSVRFGPESDRGWNVCEIFIDFDDGGTQGFCFGLGAKKNIPKARREICALFGVGDERSLKGKRCYALRCFDQHNELIEGLETMEGLRFTRTGWARRMGYDPPDNLEYRKEHIRNNIKQAQDRIAREEAKLRKLDELYVDWEK